MFEWWGSTAGSLWAWWWVIPLIMCVLCMSMCLFGRRKTSGWHCCAPGRNGYGGSESAQKEIRELREEIEKLKKGK